MKLRKLMTVAAAGISVATVTLVLVGASVPESSVPSRVSSRAFASLPQGRWEHRATFAKRWGAVQHADVVGHHGSVWLAVSSIVGSDSATVRVFRLSGRRWVGPVGSRRFESDVDTEIDLFTAGSRLCLAPTKSNRPVINCLENGGWSSEGSSYQATDGRLPANAFAMGPLLVQTVNSTIGRSVNPGGLAGNGQSEAEVYLRSNHKWSRFTESPVAQGGHESQRAIGFGWKNRVCVAYDDVFGATTFSRVGVKCASNGAWQTTAPEIAIDGSHVQTCAAVVVAGDPYVCALLFNNQSGDFDQVVYRLRGDRWEKLGLGSTSKKWASQARLWELGGRLWELRFDQQPLSGGRFAGNLVVSTYDPNLRRAERVGQPLVRSKLIPPPLVMGLAAVGRERYALYSSLNDRTASVSIYLDQFVAHR